MNDLKITVDYRETASGITDLLKNNGALVEIAKLSYGDYIINDTITVERKTAKNFLISIIDGRLFNQLSNLKKFCNHPILLIEGNPYETDHNFDRMAFDWSSYPNLNQYFDRMQVNPHWLETAPDNLAKTV